jgi:hypothetical protein
MPRPIMAAVAAAAVTSVSAYPYYKPCNSFPTAPYTAMTGTWTQSTNSASITNVNNVVSVTIPSGQAGMFFQTSVGSPTTSSFTVRNNEGSGCDNSGDSVVASTQSTLAAGTKTFTVNGLSTSNCGAVTVYAGYTTGFAAGTILSKTLDLCTTTTSTASTASTSSSSTASTASTSSSSTASTASTSASTASTASTSASTASTSASTASTSSSSSSSEVVAENAFNFLFEAGDGYKAYWCVGGWLGASQGRGCVCVEGGGGGTIVWGPAC